LEESELQADIITNIRTAARMDILLLKRIVFFKMSVIYNFFGLDLYQ